MHKEQTDDVEYMDEVKSRLNENYMDEIRNKIMQEMREAQTKSAANPRSMSSEVMERADQVQEYVTKRRLQVSIPFKPKTNFKAV